jgi:hypothetical protein
MATKGKKLGARITVSWGSVKVKQAGKTVTKTVYSTIPSTIATKFGLKAAKTTAMTVGKDKKGRQILKGGRPTQGSKYLLASVGEKNKKGVEKFQRIRLPGAMSLAKAAAVLKAGGKVTNIKYPNGGAKPIRQGK